MSKEGQLNTHATPMQQTDVCKISNSNTIIPSLGCIIRHVHFL